MEPELENRQLETWEAGKGMGDGEPRGRTSGEGEQADEMQKWWEEMSCVQR